MSKSPVPWKPVEALNALSVSSSADGLRWKEGAHGGETRNLGHPCSATTQLHVQKQAVCIALSLCSLTHKMDITTLVLPLSRVVVGLFTRLK